MALVSLNSNSLHGFNASLEIDRSFFGHKNSFTTELKIVDGMPDVKWYIRVNANDPGTIAAALGIYAFIESKSENEIQYKINNKEGTCVYGTKIIRIVEINLEDLFARNGSRYFDRNGKYKLNIEGSFSYTDQSNFFPKICNPSDWGLRLKENSEEDFEIVVDGKNFKVHKFILAAESTVFKRMFEGNFKEAVEGKVTITDSDPQYVKSFIDYCYGQDISTENDADKINLLYFADIYDCQTLKPQLELILVSKISKENISLFVSTADNANALQLRQACIKFVRNLIKNDTPLTAEEMVSFDLKFVKEIFAFPPKN